ncbi:prolyl hydroxylase family protein [Aneurinibacillus sp. REN35]|uniref:prolyl hydroxylase family protein n=1 Tax=Aneurinibacillus sp. REN35 TaxID=3237286 RepID=UPI003526FA86
MPELSVIYHDDPFIAYYEQVATPIECRRLIQLAKSKLRPATVIKESGLEVSEARLSEHTWFPHHSWLVREIAERMASLVKKPLTHAEQLQIARYQVGGKFEAHFDCYDLSTKPGRMYFEQGGQRLCTAILYLNTVGAGGETCFPGLDLQITPKEGDLLLFENCKKGTNEAHPLSLHEGRAVNEGEKWIATLWFREKNQY